MGIEEGGGSEGLSASEKTVLEIKEYLKDAVKGDPRYEAFLDIDIDIECNQDLGDLFGKTFKYTDRTQLGRQLVLLGNRFVALDAEIEKNKITIPGYKESLLVLQNKFADLRGNLTIEYKKMFPKDANSLGINDFVNSDFDNYVEVIKNYLTKPVEKRLPELLNASDVL